MEMLEKEDWVFKKIYDSDEPENEEFPESLKFNPMQRLLLIKSLRPDKL